LGSQIFAPFIFVFVYDNDQNSFLHYPPLNLLFVTLLVMVFYSFPSFVFLLVAYSIFVFFYVYVHGDICDGSLLFPLFYIFACANASNGYILSFPNVFALDILFKMKTLFFPFICVFILDVIHGVFFFPLTICFYSWCSLSFQ